MRVRAYDPIVSDELWEHAQVAVANDKPVAVGSPLSTFIFTGLQRCSACGGMQIETASGRSKKCSCYNCLSWLKAKTCASRRRSAR